MNPTLPLHLQVNGQAVACEADASRSLLEMLREDLGLTGTHQGCDTAQCGACTVLGTFMLPQFAAASGATQSIIQLDDGGASNRFMLRNPIPLSAVTVNRVAAGAVAGDASVGTPTAGVAFAAGLTIDGSGRLAASVNGGSVGVRTGGPTSGLTTLRVGIDSSGASALFGDIGYLDILPYPVSDAQLQALVAAMPLV